MSQSQNAIFAAPLTWRHVSDLHKDLGARSIRSTLTLPAASSNILLLDTLYSPDTIDRIIGCIVNAQNTGAGTFTMQDVATQWRIDMTASSKLGTNGFNIETGPDGAHLRLAWSGAAALTVNISLYNFEIPPQTKGFV